MKFRSKNTLVNVYTCKHHNAFCTNSKCNDCFLKKSQWTEIKNEVVIAEFFNLTIHVKTFVRVSKKFSPSLVVGTESIFFCGLIMLVELFCRPTSFFILLYNNLFFSLLFI